MADAQTCEVGVTLAPIGMCGKETEKALFTEPT
jgi:hypothetical protein